MRLYVCGIIMLSYTLLMEKFTFGHNILLLPFPWPSHFTLLETIGIELERRGHHVTIAAPSSEAYAQNTRLKLIVYKVSAQPNTFVSIAERRLKLKEGFGVDWLSEFSKRVADFGGAILENKDLAALANSTDLIISDLAFFVAPVIATYHKIPWVSLAPFGHMAGFQGDMFGASVNPSYVPVYVATAAFERVSFGQQMSFLERSFNFLAYICTWTIRELIINKSLDELVRKYGTDSGTVLTRKTSMVLIPMDYALEYPRMDPPHIKLIGPLTPCNQKDRLESPFSDIVDENDGIILVVSLGITSALNDADTVRLLEAFESINYTVIMKYNTTIVRLLTNSGKVGFYKDKTTKESITRLNDHVGKVDEYVKEKRNSTKGRGQRNVENVCLAEKVKDVFLRKRNNDYFSKHCSKSCPIRYEVKRYDKNAIKEKRLSKYVKKSFELFNGVHLENETYVFDFLPQQKLLQYTKDIILITHCGLNSVYEALYHARLLICVPLFGDHFDTAGRVLDRKLGRVIALDEVTEDRLRDELDILIHDESYMRNVKKASERLKRRQMTPVGEAAFWIEAVLSENGDMGYLKPGYMNMWLPEYLCLDIILFWLALLVLLIKCAF